MKLKSKMNNEVSKQTLLQAVLRRDLVAFVVKFSATAVIEIHLYIGGVCSLVAWT